MDDYLAMKKTSTRLWLPLDIGEALSTSQKPSDLEPIIYPFADKFYLPAILVKHHTWFLPAANLFISLNGVLYGVHQSYFNQSPLFQEILQYEENEEIGTNPSYPILFDTLKKKIYNNLLHLLYFGTE
jgi:hypothetical protein